MYDLVEVEAELLEQAKTLSGLNDSSEITALALRTLIERQRQNLVLDLFGSIDFHPHFEARFEGILS